MADTLIVKQNRLDDVTSQRQALQMRCEAEASRHAGTIASLQAQLEAATDDLEAGTVVQKPRNFQTLKQKYVPPQAANIIDNVAIFAVNVLRRFPLARLVFVGYLVLLHLMAPDDATHGTLLADRAGRARPTSRCSPCTPPTTSCTKPSRPYPVAIPWPSARGETARGRRRQ
jgi:hypothetical protein